MSEQQTKQHKQAFRSNAKKGKHEFAKFLVEKYNISTIKGNATSTIYVYNNGIYIEGESILRKEIQTAYEEEATSNVKNEIINQIKDLTYILLEETQKDNYSLIPIEGGIYNIETSEMIEYHPDYYFFSKLPVTYNPDSDCPLHKKFFSEVLEPQDVPLVQELFGFTLYRKIFLKKAFILIGEKNTGKSTFLKTLTNLIGLSNISGVSLQKLSNDKFSIGNLFRKYANIYDDLDEQGINNHGAFKIASGGGIVSGEKKFGDEFQFINYAKSIFACNKIPDVKNINDDAYFDRWTIINFNKTPKEVDVFLDEKLKSEEEISGLFNWALMGLKRLLQNKKFSNYLTSEETKNCMLKNSNSMASFAQDHLVADSNANFLLNEEMYKAYRNYCINENIAIESETKFHRNIDKHATYIIKNTSALNKYAKQMRGYSGVSIKETKARDMSGWTEAKDVFVDSEGNEVECF